MRLFLLILTAALVLTVGFVAAGSYLYRTSATAEGKVVVIPPHMGAGKILSQLHEEGLLPPVPLVALPVYLSGAYRSLKAGEYEIEAGATPAMIIGKIARGEIVVHKVTVPEGWNIYQVREALEAEPLLSGELPPAIAEGSVFPDTVHFTRGEARSAVLKRMQERQQDVLMKAWVTKPADAPVATPEEALILASIIEKETGIAQERGLVAGVFANRLRIGMPLQTDPSVAYGIVVAQGGRPMNRPLSAADLKRDGPYNTYTRAGLPPTPICNPGLKAIEAALNPTPTDALYFVATGQGGHNFSATMKEHERNVSAYRKQERKKAAH